MDTVGGQAKNRPRAKAWPWSGSRFSGALISCRSARTLFGSAIRSRTLPTSRWVCAAVKFSPTSLPLIRSRNMVLESPAVSASTAIVAGDAHLRPLAKLPNGTRYSRQYFHVSQWAWRLAGFGDRRLAPVEQRVGLIRRERCRFRMMRKTERFTGREVSNARHILAVLAQTLRSGPSQSSASTKTLVHK
jgi:hypothetical protein